MKILNISLSYLSSQISVISRIVPSPDWFVGVDSLDLCIDSTWVEEITLDVSKLYILTNNW